MDEDGRVTVLRNEDDEPVKRGWDLEVNGMREREGQNFHGKVF